MKRMKFLNGISAMFALVSVALATGFASCEKEEFNVEKQELANAKAEIRATVLYVDESSTTNVTDVAAITYSDGPTFTGNPALSARTVTVTATYNGVTETATVNVPALEAGQYVSLSTTIILQKTGTVVPTGNAKAVITPVVLYVADGVTNDVTKDATIVYNPANGGVFEGTPDLKSTTSQIIATYGGVSATVTVDVPALAAGQYATMSPIIVLNKKVEGAKARVEIKPIVLYMTESTATDVTASADIKFNPDNGGVFEGNPAIEAGLTSTITATHKGQTASVTVNVPAVPAGEFTILTPTILLVAAEPTVRIEKDVMVETKSDPKKVDVDNISDFWYNVNGIEYTEKTGSKIVDKVINTKEPGEVSQIEDFVKTLAETYEENTKSVNVKVDAHSRVVVSVTYSIVETVYRFERVTTTPDTKAITRGTTKEEIAKITVNEFTTSEVHVSDPMQIPGHGHAPAGHGHGHGDDQNSGGGIVIPD